MLALRLARGAHSLVQLRRLLVAAASAGTGFLLLCTLGYALAHPDPSAGALLRLLWCFAPVAATVYFAVAVARTDPGTRPRPGLSAVGLGPGQLMAISAVTTALSTTLGSVLALLVFLHLRGDLPGMRFDGDAAFLASDHPLPLPAALTLLLLVPLAASSASAVVLRPRGARPTRPRRPGAAGDSPVSGPVGAPSPARTPTSRGACWIRSSPPLRCPRPGDCPGASPSSRRALPWRRTRAVRDPAWRCPAVSRAAPPGCSAAGP